MDALKFLKSQKRMCDYYTGIGCCNGCPFYAYSVCIFGKMQTTTPELAIELLELWNKDHPAETNADKFESVFGLKIRCDRRLDKDRRAFVIEADDFGRKKTEDWLNEEYEEPKDEKEKTKKKDSA